MGKEPKTACKVEETGIMSYINHISILLERVLNQACELNLLTASEVQNAEENSIKRVGEILDEPEKMLEVFADFLNKALNLTATYNEYTKLLWHLRKITKGYIEKFYPKILEPDVFKFFQDLGLREYIVPNVDDPDIRDMYTIFSFDYALRFKSLDCGSSMYRYVNIDGMEYRLAPSFVIYLPSNEPCKTIGGCLCRINELIWYSFTSERFQSVLKLVVDHLPDPLWEWIKEFKVTFSHDCYFIGSSLDSYESLSRLEECLQAIFVGIAELVMGERGIYVFRKKGRGEVIL